MDVLTTCMIMFDSKHQSERVVVGSEETIIAQSPEISIVPSFTFG